MVNLMVLWAEGFARHHPNVRMQVEGKGSGTAPPALIAGTAQLGPMSRAMRDSEIDAIESRYGYKPTQLSVGVDVLAVYVHKDNPIQGLSLQEVDAVFSKVRRGGYPNDVTTWGQLGLTGDLARRPISMFGRNAASGTYAFFRDNALFRGDYKDTVKEQPGSASVVQGVTEDIAAIGYSGIGYRTSGVRAISLGKQVGGPHYAPNAENAASGNYPLARHLYLYVVRDPRRPMDQLTREFLRFVLSREGQEIVIKDGYLPLSSSTVQRELARLD
jgi:phosphate transport system substrate-binding protein